MEFSIKIPSHWFWGEVEPEVGAGKAYFRQGFGHAPMNGVSRAEVGDTTTVRVNALTSGLYEQLSACSTEVEDNVTAKIGISSFLKKLH